MSDRTNKRQLIVVWNYLEWGGAQIYFLGIMKLATADWDITVLLPGGSDEKLLGFLDTLEVRYEFLKGKFDLAPATTVARKFERRFNILCSELNVFRHLLKFDLRNSILHIEAAPWQSASLLTSLSLARGAHIFVTLHNALPDAPRWRELIWKLKIGVVSQLPRFRVFASNKDTKDRFRRWVNQEFFETIKVTYTTVNPPQIEAVRGDVERRKSFREMLGIQPEDMVVLCLGQFIDRKGRWLFLEAAGEVCPKYPSARFVWITSSHVTPEDLKKVESYDLGDRFRLVDAALLGRDRDDVLSAYLIADIYALPSYVEGLPVALLEAMAMGVPSISTNVYAIPEAIIHEETGLLIEAGRADQLAEAISRLLDDPAFRERLGSNGRAFVTANFDERIASQIAIDAYREALADG